MRKVQVSFLFFVLCTGLGSLISGSTLVIGFLIILCGYTNDTKSSQNKTFTVSLLMGDIKKKNNYRRFHCISSKEYQLLQILSSVMVQ